MPFLPSQRLPIIAVLALLSVALNLLFGYQLYRIGSAAPAVDSAPALHTVTAAQLDPAHPLLGQTLQSTSERAIIAQQLKLQLWSGYPRSSDYYWRADYSPLPSTWLQHRRNWLAQSRQQLLQLFGATAVYEPLFSEFFFPLRELLPFLSSDAHARLFSDAGQTVPRPLSVEQAFLHSAHYVDSQRLAELLSPPELFEYGLRYSATAQRLRGSGVALDEQTFREIFDRARRYHQRPNAARLAALQQILEALLEPAVAQQLLEQLRAQP
jgi:hypothetical protein